MRSAASTTSSRGRRGSPADRCVGGSRLTVPHNWASTDARVWNRPTQLGDGMSGLWPLVPNWPPQLGRGSTQAQLWGAWAGTYAPRTRGVHRHPGVSDQSRTRGGCPLCSGAGEAAAGAGEPGTGKTLLAEAVAEALDMPLITWHVKSTTRAQEGLYHYDTVQRLTDLRDHDMRDIREYIHMGALGRFFNRRSAWCCSSTRSTRPTSGSPTTFSTNSTACGSRSWTTGDEVAAHRPVGHHHQQRGKELPGRVPAPLHLPTTSTSRPRPDGASSRCTHPGLDRDLMNQALTAFFAVRMDRIRKPPSTSELVDWIAMLPDHWRRRSNSATVCRSSAPC